MSTLLFVAQLEPIPTEALELEARMVVRMFPGPGKWVSPQDTWFFRESFGLAKSAQSLNIMAQLYSSAIGTCVLRYSLIPPRPKKYDGSVAVFFREAPDALDKWMKRMPH